MTFDLTSTPLDKGVMQIEASAGTGKTHALAGLFLRLLLEEKIPANRILVVTFTEAATAELRDRIRNRLAEALQIFEGKPTQDNFLKTLKEKLESEGNTPVCLIRNALEMFDLVSISTIHGFCQRTLQDTAFESGLLFDVGLEADQDSLVREIAADYFRDLNHQSNPILASVAVYKSITPHVLSLMLKRRLTFPEVRVISETGQMSVQESEKELNERFEECVYAWKEVSKHSEEVLEFFQSKPKWTKGDHAKAISIEMRVQEMNGCLHSGAMSTRMWKAIEFFSISSIQADIAGNKQMPEPHSNFSSLFECCKALCHASSDWASTHRLRFLERAQDQLSERKHQAKQQSFDDLITRLAISLDGQGGDTLARSVCRKYQVALIDEFQDTDPLQSKIFHRIFGKRPDHRLYLIGDPKQAIYGFRGADVHTYLKMESTDTQKYSLETNWRSETSLVQAINTLFKNADKKKTAFVEEGIQFSAVGAGGKADQKPFTIAGKKAPPLQVWSWAPEGGTTVGVAHDRLPVAVAAEISNLLGSDSRFGEDQSLKPRDIAVLVESHKQANRMQQALHDLDIPSVEQAMESVLESQEAREVQWILEAILSPNHESGIKAALTTDLLGKTGNQLHKLVSDEELWQQRLQSFAHYRECWGKHGFYFMFSSLLRHENIFENLLRFSNGERRITNLMHVAELLASTGDEQHLSMPGLVQWLEEQRLGGQRVSDSFQLRLESDEDAVQIVTIHRSKGLQYPVVFCPFFSKEAKLKPLKNESGQHVLKEVVLFHSDEGSLTWDLSNSPEDKNRQQATREQLAENVRLLYVALTRACNRCYLVSAAYKSRGTKLRSTALEWLMRSSNEEFPLSPGSLTSMNFNRNDWLERQSQLFTQEPKVQQDNDSPIEIQNLETNLGKRWEPLRESASELVSRTCQRQIKHRWILSSFSQLSSKSSMHHPVQEDMPDHDESTAAVPETDTPEVAKGIFALPKGAQTGDCLHKILEEFEFNEFPGESVKSIVDKHLRAFGIFEEEHAQAIYELLDRLPQVSLDRDQPDLTLSRIDRSHRLTELEFHFPASSLDGQQLVKRIRNSPADSLAVHSDIPSSKECGGVLKGFIDLVFECDNRFYLLDWKSNWLGNQAEDYSQKAMARAVREHNYDLQYHLYTVALDKYLRMRLPDYNYTKNFGGVRYIFLRGITQERSELGVYCARPSMEMITGLSEMLGKPERVER